MEIGGLFNEKFEKIIDSQKWSFLPQYEIPVHIIIIKVG